MGEAHSWLKVERWYHLLVALGASGFIASLTIEVKGLSNAQSLLLSCGILFVGIGEWINHPLQTKLMHPSVYAPGGGVITGYPRNPSNIGHLFDVLGMAFLAIAAFKIAAA